MAAVITLPGAGSSHTETRLHAGEHGNGLFRRLVSAIEAARQRQADREIAEALGRRGGIMAEDYVEGLALRGRFLPRDIPAMRPGR